MATFIKVAKASEILAEAGRLVEVGGKQIALFEVEGNSYAIDNTDDGFGAGRVGGVRRGESGGR